MRKLHVRPKDQLNTNDSVILIQPLSNWVYLGLTVFGLLVVILMAANLRYSDRKVVNGHVMPERGIIKIHARTGGIVEKLFIRNGEAASANAPVAIVSNRDIALEDGTDLSAALRREGAAAASEKHKQLSNIDNIRKVNLQAYAQREAFLSDSLRQLLEQQKIGEKLLEQKKQTLARVDDPAYSAVISKFERARVHQEYLEQQEKLLTMGVGVRRIRQEMDELNTTRLTNDLALQDSLSKLAVELSALKQEQSRASANDKILIGAPEAGTVASVRVHEGQAVTPASLLMTLIPKSSNFHVELLVPSAAIGSIKRGQRVLLRFDAFPHEIYGLKNGVIKHVDEQIMLAEELADLPVKPADPVYKVTVELDSQFVEFENKRFRFRSGMVVTADILLEERSVLSWILKPILMMERAIN